MRSSQGILSTLIWGGVSWNDDQGVEVELLPIEFLVGEVNCVLRDGHTQPVKVWVFFTFLDKESPGSIPCNSRLAAPVREEITLQSFMVLDGRLRGWSHIL